MRLDVGGGQLGGIGVGGEATESQREFASPRARLQKSAGFRSYSGAAWRDGGIGMKEKKGWKTGR